MKIPFVSKYLHRQIYATVLGCLLAVVAAFGIAAFFAEEANVRDNPFDTTAQLARLLVPAESTPQPEIERQIKRVGEHIDMRVSLYDKQGILIANHGKPGPKPRFRRFDERGDRDEWQFGRRGRLIMKLDDGRWLVVDRKKAHAKRRIFRFIAFLALLAAAIGLGALPFVKRLTGRIQRLQTSVEQIGAGDLSVRAPVEGRDEVAALAKSFNESAAQIETLVQSNKMLLANASHELRTPLARIRLGVEMSRKGITTKRRDQLEQDIAELDGLIDEILLMSRLDTDQKPNMGEGVDLLALAAEEATHYADCTIEGGSVIVLGNEKLLRRMVRNLLDNASKHGQPPIEVTIMTGPNEAILCVADGGDGIAESERENAFNPFQRGRGKQNVPGFGLGLALVRQIAETHNGNATIADGPKSEIVVCLPLT